MPEDQTSLIEYRPYPIIGVAPPAKEGEGSGIVGGTDTSEETKKRIWTLAQERQIEDTAANRNLAYRIDSLVRFISNIKRFSILKSYYLTSKDDTANEALMEEIDTFITEIHLMRAFLQVFTPLQIEGVGHLQKITEGTKLTGFAVLENLVKHTDPVNVLDYYYFQSQLVSKDWRDPEVTETETKRVWFIDESLREQYTAIKNGEDTVLNRDMIVEILNSEAGESNLQTILSFVFIKNFLLQLLPNLIEIVTTPSEQIIYDTVDKTGAPCIPVMPPDALKEIDNVKYTAGVTAYNAWKANLTELVNRITNDRTKQKKSVHPDTITEEVLESGRNMNFDVIGSLIHVLDTQIAYGMNFSLSLISAHGSELSTGHTIFTTVAVTMRGIQKQFQAIAEELIYERFSAAKAAGIKFNLDELNPEDALNKAQRNKLNAETADILNNAGFDPVSVSNFVASTIDENLEFYGDQPTSEVEEAASKVVEGMLDYRNYKLDELEVGTIADNQKNNREKDE